MKATMKKFPTTGKALAAPGRAGAICAFLTRIAPAVTYGPTAAACPGGNSHLDLDTAGCESTLVGSAAGGSLEINGKLVLTNSRRRPANVCSVVANLRQIRSATCVRPAQCDPDRGPSLRLDPPLSKFAR